MHRVAALKIRTVPFACALALACSLASADPAETQPTPGEEALDCAFRFAAAIDPDPTDKARAQHSVVLQYTEAGSIDRAIELAATIDGWRRGVAWADLAAALVRAGRSEDARVLLGRAREARQTAEGWHGPRIDAHIADALALLGEGDTLDTIAKQLVEGDARQYEGRTAAMRAASQAARGELDEALATLAAYDDNPDLDIAWWRTSGYLTLGRQTRLEDLQRIRALDAALTSARQLPDWRRAAALEAIADEWRELGRPDRSRQALEAAERAVLGIADELPMKGPVLGELAAAWARDGSTGHARELARRAEPLVPRSMAIEQPGILAGLASAWIEIGDREEASRLFGRALDATAGLANARPRALAVVAVCTRMGRHGWALDEAARSRLESLHTGLGDPW